MDTMRSRSGPNAPNSLGHHKLTFMARLMDEVCIVLDENDKPVGNFSKKIC
jgi:hypothetical protein